MNKVEQIKKLLEYLGCNNRSHYDEIISHNDGCYTSHRLMGIDLPEVREREEHIVTIDTDKEEIRWYAYDISHHNGDHYNCEYGTWPNYESCYDSLMTLAKIKMERDLIKEAESDQKKARDAAIAVKLSKLIND